ncbi:hypothetical protein LTR84_003664 [Exophiala bonariae]|uniref:C2H2-type domain-containing protein n=1 Tax=Exophiala bonariae TaxID=1690606 RepID=A0AAV9N9W5_9EURO|nr:hypothetical protein LTR84_003664 [Exophiala bonariae]
MAQNPISPSRSYELALQNFRLQAGLTVQELADLEMTTLEDLQKALATMQIKQQNTKKLMYLKRLQPFLDALEQYSKVINIFVNTSNFVAFVWVTSSSMNKVTILTVSHRSKTASNVSDAFNALLDGYRTIGEQMPLLLQYSDLFKSNPYMQKALASIFEDVLEFHLLAVQLFKQRSWRQLFHATKQSLTRKVKDVAESMERHTAIMQTQASLAEYQRFEAFRTNMKAEIMKLQQHEHELRYGRVQEWLSSPVDSRARQDHAIEQRFGNSGQWLLDDQQFRNWFAPDHCTDPLLWLHGIPGAGKTILASIIVEESSKVPDAVSLCFYCKQSDQQTSRFLAVAKALLSQLLLMNSYVLDYLFEKAANGGENILSSTAVAKEYLGNALRSCPKVYIVLDGLDEYSRDDRKELATWFRDLINSLPDADLGSIRCLFVSQEDGFARKDLSTLSQIRITPSANRANIESYCRYWHGEIENKLGPLIKPQHHVANIVTARAQGMFLFAKLVTWNLYEQTSRADFEKEMQPDRVPAGLDEAYDRIIERLTGPTVSPSRRRSLLKLLGWLTCARRPLKWFEIQCAVSVNLEKGLLSPEQQFLEDCKDLCASLVEIDSTQAVTLVHSTTRGYLIRKEHVRESEVEVEIATRCVAYLGMEEFECNRPEEHIRRALFLGLYSFADYAACFWAMHLESAISKFTDKASCLSGDMVESLESFLNNHWRKGSNIETVSKTLREHLQALESHDRFNSICEAVAWAKGQLRSTPKRPSDTGRLHLLSTMSQIRFILENASESLSTLEEQRKLLMLHYGANHFKCDRMYCQAFHEGFQRREERDQHVSKHERSFTCAFFGCPYEIIGFVAKKELQMHILDQHGITTDDDQVDFPGTGQDDTTRQTTRFQCTICTKSYTRAHNLRSHLRTHTDERPFRCTICPEAFTRQDFLTRHERGHKEGKNLICGGRSQSAPDTFWGCKRRFGELGQLVWHLMPYRKGIEQTCIMQFRAMVLSKAAQQASDPQEVVLRQIDSQTNALPSHPSAQSSNFLLRAALLDRYPMLQDSDLTDILGQEDVQTSGDEENEGHGDNDDDDETLTF